MEASSPSSSSAEQRILHRLSVSSDEAVPFDHIQQELRLDPTTAAESVRQLLKQNLIRLQRSSGGGDRIFISLVHHLSESHAMVLDAIRTSGSAGMDQSQLLAKVRLPRTELLKALNSLISQEKIKERRSITNRAKRIYLLFHMDPSANLTGGTLYCGEELDTTYIDEWRRELTSFIASRRMVSMDHIKRHVDTLQNASYSGGSGSGNGGMTPINGAHGTVTTNLHHSSNGHPPVPLASSAYVVSTVDPSRPGQSSGGAATPAMTSGGVKQLSEADMRTLVQTLVLDGIVDVVCGAPAAGGEPQYQISLGRNVMRHFTVEARRRRQRSPPRPSAAAGVAVKTEEVGDSDAGGSFPPSQYLRTDGPAVERMAANHQDNQLPDVEEMADWGDGDGGTSLLKALRQESQWTAAPISRPSGQDAVDGWAYLPAVGFPCLGCPQLLQCSTASSGCGIINMRTCTYLAEWLN